MGRKKWKSTKQTPNELNHDSQYRQRSQTCNNSKYGHNLGGSYNRNGQNRSTGEARPSWRSKKAPGWLI